MRQYDASILEFVDTYEAYSNSIFIGQNHVAIPYINIGLMSNNPINNQQSVVDYSYYVFKEVVSMHLNTRNGTLSFDFNNNTQEDYITEHIIFGGYQNDNGAEAIVKCEALIFFIPLTAKVESPRHPFVPMNTPNFKQNISTESADAFFRIDQLPLEVRSFLGACVHTLNLK
jgi:hypothetical protein